MGGRSAGSGTDAGDNGPPLLGSVEFEQCYVLYGPQVYRYIARRLGPDHAEDLSAQTFTEAWDTRYRFDSDLGEVRAWLFGIATNLIRRHHRSEQRQLKAFARLTPDADSGVGDDADIDRLDAQAAVPALCAALLELRSVDRELFWLHATTDLTYAELAEATGTPVGTVRSRLSRTRDKLRAACDIDGDPVP